LQACPDALLCCHGLSYSYGGRRVLRAVTLHVRRGEIVALVGDNGAGKSTLLRGVAGALRLDGQVRIGTSPPPSGSGAGASGTLGYSPQEPAFYPSLTVGRNLRFAGQLAGLGGNLLRVRVDSVQAALGLAAVAGRRAAQLSGGQRRRLCLAMALLADPAVLVLDEVTEGIDLGSRSVLLTAIRSRAAAGAGVLLATHLVDEVEELEAQVVVLRRGEVIRTGTAMELAHAYGIPELEVEFEQAVPVSAYRGVTGRVVASKVVVFATPAPEQLAAQLMSDERYRASIRAIRLQRPTLRSAYQRIVAEGAG
jgi:ABC-2 type transport system ATP-binding protein